MSAINGILLLDKPRGFSSNQALQKVKRLLRADKAGHTGSLDPLATGMLPLCLGEATKVAGYLLGSRKAYEAVVRLGVATTTADAEGQTTATGEVPDLDEPAIASLLRPRVGRIMQRPPAYSALKRDGVPLYRLARRGEDVVTEERPVEVHEITLLDRTPDTLRLRVVCGTGTYIRSLAVSIGEAAGCGAHLAALRRLWVDPFVDAPMLTMEQLQERCAESPDGASGFILPIDAALVALPRVSLDAAESARVEHGNPVQREGLEWTGLCRMHDDSGRLAALGERLWTGVVRVQRLIRA